MKASRPPRPGTDFHAIGIAGLVLSLGAAPVSFAESVEFEDANLETLVRARLQIENGPVTTADMERLTTLNATRGRIDSVRGLEPAVNLEELHLRDNRLTDISPLAGLTRLRILNLRNNRVGDLASLADLENLEILGLRDNRVADISPLAGKPQLRHLDLRNNRSVSDLSPLAELHGLEWLSLRDCTVADIRPLAGLVRLRRLDLHHNHLADISLLNGLPDLEWVDLRRNHLRMAQDRPTVAAILQLIWRAETVHYSPQRRGAVPETALAAAKEIRAALESQIAVRQHEGIANPGGLAATETNEQILFASGVELILVFAETAEEMALRFTEEENAVEITGSEFEGIYTYIADQPSEANLRMIFGRNDGRRLLHYHKLDLLYGTPDTGRFEGWFESEVEDPRLLSGSFQWHFENGNAFTADLMKADADSILLRRPGGVTETFPIASLSLSDRDHLDAIRLAASDYLQQLHHERFYEVTFSGEITSVSDNFPHESVEAGTAWEATFQFDTSIVQLDSFRPTVATYPHYPDKGRVQFWAGDCYFEAPDSALVIYSEDPFFGAGYQIDGYRGEFANLETATGPLDIGIRLWNRNGGLLEDTRQPVREFPVGKFDHSAYVHIANRSAENEDGARFSLRGRIDTYRIAKPPSPQRIGQKREWIDAIGRSFNGELLKLDDEAIVVRRIADDREFRIPIQNLSKEDQGYLHQIRAAARRNLIAPQP